MTRRTAKVDEAALCEKEYVAARRHSETVNLGFNVDNRLRMGLEPSYINFNVEVADAARWMLKDGNGRTITKTSYFDTMASSGMTSKCLPWMISLQPVVVTKMLAR